MPSSRVLITGGAGFIGSRLALELVARGHSVRILDNLCPQVHGPDPSVSSPTYKSVVGEIELIRDAVTSREAWLQALEDRDAVIHMAAETGTNQSMCMVEHYCNVNITGLSVLLDVVASRKSDVRKVILASSRSIYGEGKYRHPTLGTVYPAPRKEADLMERRFEVTLEDGLPLLPEPTDETAAISPSSIYAVTKQVQEQLLKVIARECGIDWVVFRYQNVYGPGQSVSNPYTGIFPQFIRKIMRGEPVCIYEDGMQSRDFVFVDDVVRATVAGLEDERAVGTTFNVGSGSLTTIRDGADLLMKKLRRFVPVEMPGIARSGDIRHCFADVSLLAGRLGVRPFVLLDEGVERLVDWLNRS